MLAVTNYMGVVGPPHLFDCTPAPPEANQKSAFRTCVEAILIWNNRLAACNPDCLPPVAMNISVPLHN